MADTLPTLIRLAERRVEDVTQALTKIRAAMQAVREDIQRCHEEASAAFVNAVAEDDVLNLQAAGAFQERIRREVERLREAEASLLEQEQLQNEALRVAFAEQKRYEILLEKKKLAERKAKAKKAQNALDELGNRRA